MWYNTIPSFVPMDFNMYFAYYSRIKGHDPLISRRKERYAIHTTQLEWYHPLSNWGKFIILLECQLLDLNNSF